MSLPLPLQTLTQGHLNSFEQCPRRYQYQYLEQLAAPLDPEFQNRTDWGSQFHLLMQQYLLGLAIAPHLGADPTMTQAIAALVAAVPQLQTHATREAEHRRLLAWSEQLLLVVVYDLLVIERDRAHILDWKTYPKPPNLKQLAHNWQTLLYPFVLVETSDYEPEQVSMTYWFVQTDKTPESWRLDYTTPQHEQVRTRLCNLWTQLQTLTTDDGQRDVVFPAVDAQQHHQACRFCPFQVRCQRAEGENAESRGNAQQVATLPEITLSSM
ncbi:MAG: PD-(D/E)XK nuclease family protein [Spirulina sp. SIO3F2]|nr:PD-(D/E)XK nuclease family protein [Spirulina sp. SIO3F2]